MMLGRSKHRPQCVNKFKPSKSVTVVTDLIYKHISRTNNLYVSYSKRFNEKSTIQKLSMSQPDAEIDLPLRRMYSNCRLEKTTKSASGVSSTNHTQTILKNPPTQQ